MEMGVVDPLILQMVGQHHERRDKSGYPNKLGAGEIHLFSEIVGISDELVNYLTKNLESNRNLALRRFLELNRNNFSYSVLKAYEKIFLSY
jgi:HD-GYP domain-containing protein (c-di-GMP phosphodiesterase class II)